MVVKLFKSVLLTYFFFQWSDSSHNKYFLIQSQISFLLNNLDELIFFWEEETLTFP